MTIRALSRAESRAVDERAAAWGLSTLVLMENAGRGAADWLDAAMGGRPGRVVVACGPGNNGGDGGVMARHLDARGHSVAVVWAADPGAIRGDAAVQRAILDHAGIEQHPGAGPGPPPADLLAAADWVVDALVGTGLTRPIGGHLAAVVAAINDAGAAGRRILAVDIPSGLDADAGSPLGPAVRADATVTFVAPKLGFGRPGAAAYTGPVHVVEIGLPRRLLEAIEAGV